MDRDFAPIPADSRVTCGRSRSSARSTSRSRRAPKRRASLEDGGTPAAGERAGDGRLRRADLDVRQADARRTTRAGSSELAKAIENGRGEDLNDAIANFVAFTEDGNSVREILDEQDPALRRLIKNSGVTLGAMNRRYGEFGELVDERERLLRRTRVAQRRARRDDRGPPDLPRRVTRHVRPAARTSRSTPPARARPAAGGEQLRPTLRDLGRLAPDLEHLFRDLDPVIDESGRDAAGGGEVPALPERLEPVRQGSAGQPAGRPRVALSVPRGAQPDPDLPQLLPGAGRRLLHERRGLAVRLAPPLNATGGPAPLPAPVRRDQPARPRHPDLAPDLGARQRVSVAELLQPLPPTRHTRGVGLRQHGSNGEVADPIRSRRTRVHRLV